jgi:hypothetical protein
MGQNVLILAAGVAAGAVNAGRKRNAHRLSCAPRLWLSTRYRHLEGYGLPGASAVSYGLACLELEAGDSGARSLVSVQGSLAMYATWRGGSEEQKERRLPPRHAARRLAASG